MVSPSPSSQGPTWVLTGLTNLDMAGQRDVYREVDGLGERWCEMTDVVVGETDWALTLAPHFPAVTPQRVSHTIIHSSPIITRRVEK